MLINKEMNCDHCNRTLSNKWTLKTHQKTSKYCLEKQNKDVYINKKYSCIHCSKDFTTKQNLSSHLNSCTIQIEKLKEERDQHLKNIEDENIKLKSDNKILCRKNKYLLSENHDMAEMKQIIIDKDKLISALEAKLEVYKQLVESSARCVEEIAKQPKIQTQHTQNIQNNKLLNLKPFDLEDTKLHEQMLTISTEFFDKNYFNEGQKGVARFAVDKLLKDSNGDLQYICTDPSRHMYKYKSNNGDIRTDAKAKLLSQMLDKTVVKVTKDMVKDMIATMTSDDFLTVSENFLQIKDITDSNGGNAEFRTELAALTTKK